MKKFIKTGKKALSVIMAVLMVMTAWVWVAPTEASAATAGKYYVEINWSVGDTKKFSNRFTGTESENGARAGLLLYYKTNNGTGTEQKVYWDIGYEDQKGTAYGTFVDASTGAHTNSKTSYTTKCIINGFPTAFYATADSDYFLDGCSFTVSKISVGKPSTDSVSTATITNKKTLWEGSGYNDTTTEWKWWKITADGTGANGVKTVTENGNDKDYGKVSSTTENWVFPTPTTTTTYTGKVDNVQCPKSGTADVMTLDLVANDQYGVEMFNPTWSVKGSVCGTNGISVSTGTTSAQKTTVRLTNAANVTSNVDTQTGTITATFGNAGSLSDTFTITDSYYTATFNYQTQNADNNTSSTTSVTRSGYHGDSITAPNPPQYYDQDYLKSFSAWTPTYDSTITKDITYTANYNSQFVRADYSEVDAAVAAAQALKDQYGAEYETRFTYDSRMALEQALQEAENEANLGRTQQSRVTGFADAINAALALKPNTFAVIFLDKNGAILEYFKDVEYGTNLEGDIPTLPADQEIYYDSENHYRYAGWDADEYKKVLDDLVVSPVYTAEAHNFSKTENVPSDCNTKGATKYICDCGYSYTVDNSGYGDHKWTTDHKDATCTAEGYDKVYCSECGVQQSFTVIPKLEHQYGTVAPLAPLTCENNGISKLVCDDCGHMDFAIEYATGHDYTTETIPSTCTEAGYDLHTCKNCDHSYKDNYKPLAAHNYDSGVVVAEARCEVPGTMKYTCQNEGCDHIKVETIAALNHVEPATWTDILTQTCTSSGYRVKYCSRGCGYVLAQEATDPSAHTYTTTSETKVTCTTAGIKTETCSACGDVKTTVTQATGHDYDDGETHNADCTHGGFIVYTCKTTDCGHKKYEIINEAAANGHNFNGGAEEVVVAATCTAEGEKTVQCVNDGCEYKITEVIPKLGHNMMAGTPVEPTCTSSGYTTYTCANNCGHTYNVYNDAALKPHNYEGVETKAATCTENGVMTYTCSACGKSYTDSIEALGHDYDIEEKAATCTAPATKSFDCSRCDAAYTEYISAAIPHSWSEWKEIQAPTTDMYGIKERTCSVCKTTETVKLAPIGAHNFLVETTKVATCEETGTRTYTCQTAEHGNCPANYSEEIPATGHTESVSYKAATCTAEGYSVMVCTKCDEELTEKEIIPAIPHNYGDGQITTPATCLNAGVKTYTCSACGIQRNETIAAKDHSLTTAYTAPVCDNTGLLVTTCKNCSDYNSTQTLDALGHNLTVTVEKATCTKEGSVTEDCQRCDYYNETVLEVIPHNYAGEVTVQKDATCTENGLQTVKCTACDATADVTVPMMGHSYPDNWELVKAADCENDGSQTKTCEYCGDVITEILPKTGHNYTAWEKVDATNDTDGSWYHKCQNDGCTKEETLVIPKGDHNLVKLDAESKAPACNEAGYETYQCNKHTDCSVKIKVDLGYAKHTVSKDILDATCTKEGYVKSYCSVCSEKFAEETTEKIAHVYEAQTPVPSTCTQSGYTPYKCACGDSYNAYNGDEADGHSYVGVVTDEPSCTKTGVKTYTCSVCSDSYTETLDMLAHTYETEETPATCTTPATKSYECDCGTSSFIEYIASANGHSWSESWTTVREATDDKPGVEKTVCTVADCGAEQFRTTAPIGQHVFESEITTQPTCTTPGVKTFTCTEHENCSANYTEPVPAKGHTETIVYTAPTCVADGLSAIVCDECNATINSKVIDKLTYNDFSGDADQTVDATCTADGKYIFVCNTENCNATKEVTIPAKGHSLVTVVKDATCGETGTVAIGCTKCDYAEPSRTLAAKGHIWETTAKTHEDATCTTDGKDVFECQFCNAENEVILPKLGHDWNDWVVTEPTNDKDGSVSRTCKRSEACTETVPVPAGGHNLVKVDAESKDASCSEVGYITYQCNKHENCSVKIKVDLALKQHSYVTTKTDATCLVDGEVLSKCACGAEIRTVIPAKGHTLEEIKNTPATCIKEGEVVYKCTDCEETKTINLPLLQHTYGVPANTPATCTTNGYNTYTCTTDGCNATYVEITDDANGHSFTEKVSSTATCTEDGTLTLKCKNCTKTMSTDVPALGHDYKLGSKSEATCAAAPTETYECSRCDASYTISVGSKAAHKESDWSAWTQVVAPTETTLGYETRTCATCGQLEGRTVAATGEHNYTVEISNTPATCETKGIIIRGCSTHTGDEACGLTSTVEIPALGHNDTSVTTPADCDTDGVITTTCSTCGRVETETIPALGHNYDSFTVKAATCNTEGEIVYTCSTCNETKSVSFDKDSSAHKLKEETDPATCKKAGSVTITCENGCGYEVVKTLPKLQHEWLGWTIVPSTNSQPGSATLTCKNGCTESEQIPIGNHSFAKVPDETTTGNCSDTESTATYYCINHKGEDACGVSITVNTGLVAHNYETTVSDATCINTGSIVTECTACGHKVTNETLPLVQHTYNTTPVKTPATCTSNGYNTYTCKIEDCNATYVEITDDAKGHTYTSDLDSVTATCTEGGQMTLKCSCGDEVTVDVLPLGHDYKPGAKTEATCEVAATQNYDCSRCDASYTISVGSKADHKESDWSAWTQVVAPTENSLGYETRSCATCGQIEGRTVAATGAHDFKDVIENVDATCTEAGYIIYACNVDHPGKGACGLTSKVIIPANGHNDTSVTIPADCDSTGTITTTCSTCGRVENETIPALGHAYGAGVVTPATCETEGKIVYTCERCDGEYIAVIPVNDKAHQYEKTIVDASCTAEGSVITKCKLCKHELVNKQIPKTEHPWGTPTTVDETCTTDGEKIYTCTVCTASKVEVIAKLGHDYQVENKTDPTCTSSGYITYKCNNCNDRYDAYDSESAVKAHSFDESITANVTVEPATCKADGLKTVKCKYCNAKKEIILPKLEHTYTETKVDATCKVEGTVTYTCDCGESYVEFVEARKAHTFGEWTETQAPTTDKFGIKERSCLVCGAPEIEKIAPIGEHDFDVEITKEATCTESGEKTYTCKTENHGDCPANYTEVIPANGHSKKSVTTPASCTADGSIVTTCDNCDYEAVEVIPMLAHTYGEGKVTDPTCTENGNITYKCECGAEKVDVIPRKGHNLSTKVKEASCTEKGMVTTSCSACNYKIETEIDEKAHNLITSTSYPGCTNTGYTRVYCSNDGCKYDVKSEIPAIGHSYEIIVTDTPSTCSSNGERVMKCLRCDETQRIELPLSNHNFEVIDEVDADCTTIGYKLKKCKDCEETYKELVSGPLGHRWSVPEVTNATCTEDGKKVYTCTVCNETRTEAIDNFGHIWSAWTVETAPTATADGVQIRTCLRNCGATERGTIPALGGVVTHTVTFVADGLVIATQTVNHGNAAQAPEFDGREKTDEYHYTFIWDTDFSNVTDDLTVTAVFTEIPHSFGEWEILNEADCNNTGLRQRSCACGYVQTEVIEKTNHAFTIFSDEKLPDCVNNGSRIETCKNCGKTETRVLPRLGHLMNYVAGYAPTCDTDGEINHFHCSRCGKNFSDSAGSREVTSLVAGKLYHSLIIIEGKPATCTEEGIKNYQYCVNCGYKQQADKIPALGHSDADSDGYCDNCTSLITSPDHSTVCSCRCHKTDTINKLFYKIFLFFWKLFGMNKSCACGNVHY